MERLWQAVEMIHASGATSISLTTRELISSAYVKTSMGLLEDDDLVKALARRRISCRPEPIGMQNAGLPDSDMVRLENELRVFFTDNIYSFIGLPLGAPLEISRRKTADKKAEWGPRKAGHLKACAQSIISHAEEYFVSEALRSRYDFSYVRRRLEEEGLLTNLTLAGIDGVLDENEWRHLVNNGVQLGYPRNQVELVVEASAKLKGVHIAAKPK